MLRDNVAQKPTIPVNAGKKKFQNSPLLLNLSGWDKIGPKPFTSITAHTINASAANGRKMALKTKSLRMLSTPNQTINIFSNQKRKNVTAGPVANPQEVGNICGNVSKAGHHNLNI